MSEQYESTTSTGATAEEPRSQSTGVDTVDPRAPRFGQALTTTFLGLAIVLQQPIFVYLTAAALTTAAVTRWRLDPWGILWKRVGMPVVGKPDDQETAAPHRFAKLLGVAGTGLATIAFLANLPLVGYVLAGAVMLAAGLGATTGLCLGCKLYGQVRFFQRLNLV